MDCADDELAAHKVIQAYAASDDVSPSCGQVHGSSMLPRKRFNLFGLDERDVLARFVMGVKVAVAFDSSTGDDTNRLLFDWRIAAWRTDEDALNAHGCL